eukprot:359285-Chlamydomonas_euryale.AAC.3
MHKQGRRTWKSSMVTQVGPDLMKAAWIYVDASCGSAICQGSIPCGSHLLGSHRPSRPASHDPACSLSELERVSETHSSSDVDWCTFLPNQRAACRSRNGSQRPGPREAGRLGLWLSRSCKPCGMDPWPRALQQAAAVRHHRPSLCWPGVPDPHLATEHVDRHGAAAAAPLAATQKSKHCRSAAAEPLVVAQHVTRRQQRLAAGRTAGAPAAVAVWQRPAARLATEKRPCIGSGR